MAKAHTLQHPTQSMCAHTCTGAYSHVGAKKTSVIMCTHSSIISFFSPLCSMFLFTLSSSFLNTNVSQAPSWLKAQGRPEANIWWREKKKGVSEYFIKYLWGTQSWVTVADNCEPRAWKSTSLSIMHQPSKGELPHVQVLWDTEYLKL